MKKLISSILLFTMLLTNVVHSMPNNGQLSDVNITQSIASDIVTTQVVTDSNFSDLKQYKDTSDVTININANTTVDEKIEITGSEERESAVVNTLDEFKAAIKISNSTITLNDNIALDEDIEINEKNIIINGNGKEISLSNQFNLRVKSTSDVEIGNIIIKDYKSTGLTIYSSNNIKLSNIHLIGKDITVPKEERSTVGLDVYASKVQLSNIQTENHLYRGIQVRNGSTVDILTANIHNKDSVHMQSIVGLNQSENTINYASGTYLPGNKYSEGDNEKLDYYSQKNIYINSVDDLKNNIQNSGNVLTLNSDLKIEQSDLDPGSDTLELRVAACVVINGNGKTIDFNNLGNITLKGRDIRLVNVTVKNSNNHAIHIYNSKNALLDSVKIETSARAGIFVNGSSVKLQNCTTMNNTEGGIAITRSRTLLGSGYSDSYVEVVGTITQEESNINVNVKNLEMTDGYIQDNKFIAPNNTYDKYVNDKAYKALSDYYLDHFNIQGEDRKKKYQEQDIDYMIIKQVIDVTKNTEVLDENGNPIRLIGDGVTDETEKIEKLIEYAASHGRELYFPEGTYKITRDIDLSKIQLPALSNFKISGDKDGLSIFDATSSTEKMLKLMHAEYKGPMNYVEIENIVFNNIGIEINGPYKKGITIKNNTFINGKYTREKREDGSILKATMEPYVIAKNTKYTIKNNIFLRGENYPGRGIATYRTKNTSISNNFFGDLDGADDAAKMLPTEVVNRLSIIKSSNLVEGHQGNFFTAINNERYDTNVLIANNYFNMMKTRNIVSDFEEDVLVSGINVAKEGQRRDHIIYSKSYDTLNIVGNYFKGMENGAAGGVKIRNGSNVYVGSNYFDDVPLLTYIYGDLSREDTLLYDTVIYNNLFHAKTNFGGEGTGILYYQSFRDGDTLSFNVKNNDGTVTKDVWENAYGDVKNFIIYKNSFLSDERDQITISGRAQTAYKNNEFLAYGNTYMESSNPVNYNTKGNLGIAEASEQLILSKVNSGYNAYKDMKIPLTPAEVDYTYLKEAIDEANSFYENIFNNSLIGSLGGQYPEEISNELKEVLAEINNLLNSGNLNQAETNKALTSITETLEKLKNAINPKGDAPVVSNITDIEISKGDTVDFMQGITITDDRDTMEQLDIKIDLGDFNNLVPGTYTIEYTVTDRDGNVITFTRDIKVLKHLESVIPGPDDDSSGDNDSDEDNNLGGDNDSDEDNNLGGDNDSDEDNNLGGDNDSDEDNNLGGDNDSDEDNNLGGDNDSDEDNNLGGDNDSDEDNNLGGDNDSDEDNNLGGDNDSDEDNNLGGDNDSDEDNNIGEDNDSDEDNNIGEDNDSDEDNNLGGDNDSDEDNNIGEDNDSDEDNNLGEDNDSDEDNNLGEDNDSDEDNNLGGDNESDEDNNLGGDNDSDEDNNLGGDNDSNEDSNLGGDNAQKGDNNLGGNNNSSTTTSDGTASNTTTAVDNTIIEENSDDKSTDEAKSGNGFLRIFTGFIKSPFSWLFLLLLLILLFKRKNEDIEELDI
ncbi:DUF5011 domain-containing protein [Clostridium sp. AL.422]|uniref:right-handed parallel beta-helix repeat-containing protein n=1 Tax=Clostridium TaxID=1485 RepID=UPI00293DA864|nr:MULTISPECIES: immunoglobulin-like domain-containing protein [unclassified Clostridium]MDV4150752.1 DUF5011 domain-containing protein [Clostridium sp. AL.422]